MSHLKTSNARGFTIFEVMIAIFVLTFGLLAVAALTAKMFGTTDNSRHLSIQAYLASEKLDELSRLPGTQYSTGGVDPALWAPDGGTAGSLTSQQTASVTSGGATETVDYYDLITISAGQGSMSETTSGKDAAGNVQFTTISQSPNGSITTSLSATAPAPPDDALFFERRWFIEKDPADLPAGVRRITVVVLDQNPSNGSAPYQTTMVRP